MDQTTPRASGNAPETAPQPRQRRILVRDRLQAIVYGALLAVIIGWVLYIGRPVFVPMVFGVLVAYIIIGLSRGLRRVPTVGRWLPPWLCYVASIASILAVIGAGVLLVVNNVGRVVQLAPDYEESLLQMIQRGAELVGIESAPTWNALRVQILEQISTQAVIGTTVVSVTAVMATMAVVLLYVTFLLVEKRVFPQKLRNLSDDPQDVSRIRQVLDSISTRTGQYLALKTLVSVILGVISWAIMAIFGVEFAGFWAVLITVLNYVPYIGSFLGVLFPVAWAIVQFGDIGTVITLLILLSSAQFVIGNFLDPWLLGNSLNLSPFVILASLTIWGALWGIPGAFLAVPITSVLAIVLSEFSGTRPIAVLMSRSGDL
ncbi:AI-2E family transporter [Luteimonas sp. A277]